MERMRSPNYPTISLPQAIDMTGRLHKSCRTNIITREDAVREMGYAGLTGRSMKVLSALLQFGLLEKTGKGDVRVTHRAVEILHGLDTADRNEAMLEAAFAPALFRNIHDRFPDGLPSDNAIRSFLIKQDFVDSAIGPAITAFRETSRSVEHIRASESHGAADEPVADAVQDEAPEEPIMTPQSAPMPAAAPASIVSDIPSILAALAKADLNDIGLSMLSGRVAVAGVLDLKGLRTLKRKIAGMEALLAPDDDDEDEEPDAERDALIEKLSKPARVVDEGSAS